MADKVIVESPGKTRRINQLLGAGYVVRASRGHVRDLPQPKRDGRSPGKQRQQVGLGLDIDGGERSVMVPEPEPLRFQFPLR